MAPAGAHEDLGDQEVSVSDGVIVVHRPLANESVTATGLMQPEIVTLRSGETVAVRRGAGIVMPERVALAPAIRNDGVVFVEDSGFLMPGRLHRHGLHKFHRPTFFIRTTGIKAHAGR
jgi:hypothetical protein